ncbi:unnamed protein product [Candida verbasci]|uniref:Reticulon-like protein n=1 Tax=Candida verbasci TaxID=1227364 RepID=A0A9W4XB95_9ASCO|nr:unnamed protein product [Candida verbasci]
MSSIPTEQSSNYQSQFQSSAIPTGSQAQGQHSTTTSSTPHSSSTTNNGISTSTSTATGETPLTNQIKQNTDTNSLCKLLSWKDPIATGKVFGSIVFSLIIFKTVNLFNIFFHLAYIGLLISAAAEYSGKLIIGKGFLENYKPTTKSYAECFNKNVLPNLAQFNLEAESIGKKIIYSHDIETTLKAAGISYILYKLTSWVSIFTLISISVILIFTIPFIYTTYKKEIDASLAQFSKCVKSKTSELTEKAHKAAGPHLDNFIKKTGPVGQFIQSKFPTRTASSTVGDSKATTYGNAADRSTTANPSTSSARSTGAQQFPNAPTSGFHPTTVEDAVHNANDTDDFADTTQGI